MKNNKFAIANWKMKLDIDESVSLANELKDKLADFDLVGKTVVLCPSFLAISEVSKVLKDSNILLGAQDVFYEDEGAFTGEISPENLKEIGCSYVIVGHSERRAMGETDSLVNKKAKAVLEHEMIPIICVGELLKDYESGKSKEVVTKQVKEALKNFENQYFIIAYEPVWSISTSGSGKVISAKEAISMIKVIKDSIDNNLNNFDIIYGGSVTDKTVSQFTKDFKGSLVGGASLKSDTFFNLIKNS